MESKRILIVEDEESVRELLLTIFGQKGYETSTSESAEKALKQLVDNDFDVAIVDIVLPGMDGIHLLNEIKHVTPDTEVIIITGHASLETSIEAVRIGAYDYLIKPFVDLDEVWFTVERAFERRNLSKRNKKLHREYEQQGEKLISLNRRSGSLIKAIRVVNSSPSVSEFLTYVVDLVASQLDVERSSIMLIDDNREYLKIAAAHGIAEEAVESFSLELGTGVPGRVAVSGRPYVLQTKHVDLPHDDRSNHEHDIELFHVALSLPIKNDEETIGVLNVTNRPSEEPFNEQDLDFLMGIADLTGIMMKVGRNMKN